MPRFGALPRQRHTLSLLLERAIGAVRVHRSLAAIGLHGIPGGAHADAIPREERGLFAEGGLPTRTWQSEVVFHGPVGTPVPKHHARAAKSRLRLGLGA